MGNWETVLEMQKAYNEGWTIGSAEKENERYLNSIEGKINVLKENLKQLVTNVISSDFAKSILDIGISLTNGLAGFSNFIDDIGLSIPTAVGFIGSLIQTIKSLGSEGQGIPNIFSKVMGVFKSAKGEVNGFNKTTSQTSTNLAKVGSSISATSSKTSVMSGLFKNLGNGLLSAGKYMLGFVTQGLAIAGVTLLVQGLAKAWSSMAHGLENAEKEITNTIDEINGNISTHQSNLKYLEDTEKRYNELIAKKKEYSSIPLEDLTEEQLADMQELQNITNELAEKFPELVVGYDSSGSPIMLMADDMGKLKERTKEQIELQQKMLKIQREELAENARKRVQEGNFWGLGAGIEEKINTKNDTYKRNYEDALTNQKIFLQAMSNGNTKYIEDHKKQLQQDQELLNKSYRERLQLYQEYAKEEIEIQQSAYDQIQALKGYDKIDDSQRGTVQSFIDNLNWAGMDESQYTSWINSGFKEIIKLAQEGSPKLEQWNSKLEEANAKYSANGDVKEYETSLKGLAKAISEDLNIPYETVFAGLENMVEPLAPAEQALQNFLKTFDKTRYDLLNGDSIAQGLAEQFEAVNNVINNVLANGNSYDDKGVLKIPMMVQIANTDGLPDQVQKLADEFSKDGKISGKESKIIVDLMYVLNEGDTEQARAKIEEINKALVAMGKEPIEIDTLFNVEGIEKLKETEDKLNKLREEGKITKETEIIVNGQDQAELYLQIIEEIQATPEMTNRFILDNQDALSKMKDIEEVKKFLQENPDIVNKYQIQGIEQGVEQLDKVKETQEELDGKETTSTHTVKEEGSEEATEKVDKLNETIESTDGKTVEVSADESNVLETIEDIETLIQLSAKVEDGKYKLEIDATTEQAVSALGELENALKNLSNLMTSTTLSTKVSIETAQGAKNLSGLITRIEQAKNAIKSLKSTNVNVNTAQSAKNLSGLIARVKQYTSAINSVLSKNININTAQSAKNVTGLIKKLTEYNNKAKTVKPINIKTNASSVTSQVNNLINKIKAVPTKKTSTINVVTKYTTQGSPTAHSRNVKVGRQANAFVDSEITENVIENIPTPMARIEAPVVNNTPQAETPSKASRATQKTPIAITGGDIASSLEFNIDLLKELEARISMVTNQLSILDKKASQAIGKEKIQYLQQQNTLYKEQMNILTEQENVLQRQINYMKYALENKGIKFNSDGNMTNYEEMLIKKEKELQALEQKANKENATDAQKKAYEKAKSALEDLKKYADEYYKVAFTELPKVKEEWLELSNSIRENTSAIKELEREQKLYTSNSALRELSMLQDVIADKMDIINEKMEHASASDKLKYQEELNKLLEEEQRIIEQQIKSYEESLRIYQNELKGYGFNFDSEGTIKNLQEILNKYQNSKDLEDLNKLLEEYFKIQRDELPDIRKEWEKNKNEILENKEAVKKLNDEIKELKEDSGYKDHERDLSEIENKLDLNQIHLDNSSGKDKIHYLEERISLTQQLKKETQDLLDFENSRRQNLMKDLGQYGFNFRDDGSIIGYGAKIEELKKTLSEEEFSKVFEMIEDYITTTNDTIPDLQQSLVEINYSIEDYRDELEALMRQRHLDVHLNKIKELENEYDKLADKLDIINVKLNHAIGKDKLNLIEEQIELLEEQKQLQSELIAEYEKMANVYQRDLEKYGIQFDENGDITNLNETLNNYQDHKDLEKLKELIDEYLEIQRDKLPDAIKEWESLSSAIKDAYKEQLEITKTIEDKITEVYKKQVEERKKLIDDELQHKLDALDKEKKAYQDARKEADYKKDFEKQSETIAELERQIEIASRDTSLSGQKKLQSLLKQLAEEQEKLQDLVQDKIDEQIESMFDSELLKGSCI